MTKNDAQSIDKAKISINNATHEGTSVKYAGRSIQGNKNKAASANHTIQYQ